MGGVVLAKIVKIALDTMGGDNAPVSVIDGADIAKSKSPNIEIIFVGDEKVIGPLLEKSKNFKSANVIHTGQAVSSGDTASQAVRRGRESSMWLAIAEVAENRADAVVSAGNTGALMAMAKLQLRTMPGITRPAIAGFFPTEHNPMCMLDLGANLECDEENLIQFALMGQAFYLSLIGKVNPSVGLLNVGEEEQKGHEYLRLAAQELSNPDLGLNYCGFVEGSDLVKGSVDIVVTDGFSGNIALKTAEGVAGLFASALRQTFRASLLSRIGYVFARNAVQLFQAKMDPRRYNGWILPSRQGGI